MTTVKRKDIQGLRALAVLVVVLYHCELPFVPGGYIGVDVFFVISGFLISGHLFRTLASEGRLKFGAFYANRAGRLLPAAFLVLTVTVLASLAFLPPLRIPAMLRDAAATAVYVPNVLFAWNGTDYLAESAPSVIQHYWSLGVEEQFYLLWPITLALTFAIFNKSTRALIGLIVGITICSFALSVAITVQYPAASFFLLPTRAWEFGLGALTAIVTVRSPSWLNSRAVGALGWLALSTIIGSAVIFDAELAFPGWVALIPVLATSTVILSGKSEWSPNMLLSVRPAQFIGNISYSLYLVHWPMLEIPRAVAAANGNSIPLHIQLAIGIACVVVAWALYRAVEIPAQDFIRDVSSRGSVLVGALAMSAVLAFSAAYAIPIAERHPLSTDEIVATSGPVLNPVGTSFVPANLNPSLRSAADSSPLLYTNGCHADRRAVEAEGCAFGANESAPLVVLFGDSHAAQWAPTMIELANRGDIRLHTFTKSSCSSALVSSNSYPQCAQWRDSVIDTLRRDRPAITLLGNYATAHAQGRPASSWADSLAAAASALAPSRVAVLADTPSMGVTPAICLSANIADTRPCTKARGIALSDKIRRAEFATGLPVIDIDEYLCNLQTCPPIIGDYLVYRDGHHIAVPFAISLMEPMLDKLQQVLNSD